MQTIFPTLNLTLDHKKWRLTEYALVEDVNKEVVKSRRSPLPSTAMFGVGNHAACTATTAGDCSLQRIYYKGATPWEKRFWSGYAEAMALFQRDQLRGLQELLNNEKVNIAVIPRRYEHRYHYFAYGGFLALSSIGIDPECLALPEPFFDSAKDVTIQEALRLYQKNRSS